MKTCLAVIMINLSGIPWNAHDFKIKSSAQYRCSTDERYKDTPCLVKFIKKEERHYNAFCGRKRKNSTGNIRI